MTSATAAWALLVASSTSPCAPSDFAEARARLSSDGRIDVQATETGLRAEVWDQGRVLWAGRVEGRSCRLAAEVVDIHIRRRLAPERVRPLGALPALPPTLEDETPVPVDEPLPPWGVEVGAGALWELGGGGFGRLGGEVDVGLGRGAWGGRLAVGLMAPDGAEVLGPDDSLGRGRLTSLHLLAFVRGCRPLWTLRLCAQLGGGVEHAWVSAEGEGVFQQAPGAAWLGRGDASLALGLGRRPGAELVLRGSGRGLRLRPSVEEAELDLRLPRWSAQLGLRGFFEIL